MHVIELKTSHPAAELAPLVEQFQRHVARVNDVLRPLGAWLMPTAMHPWMEPFQEMKLWPHEFSPVYEAFHRIFDCRGHGWANLQSVHLNLPFDGDEEFGRLHAAIRLILPILPALAASSPLVDSRATAVLDNRLDVYRANARRVPSVTGRVIPERAFTREEYEQRILRPLYADIAPLDPGGVLQDEFLNARGAIARFGRGSIEIRLLDIQECPRADLAVVAAVTAVLQALVEQRWRDWDSQQSVEIDPLERVLLATIRDGDEAVIDDAGLLAQFGWTAGGLCTAGELWRRLVETTLLAAPTQDSIWAEPVSTILNRGPLARRILRRLGAAPSRDDLRHVYRELADCLSAGRMFDGQG